MWENALRAFSHITNEIPCAAPPHENNLEYNTQKKRRNERGESKDRLPGRTLVVALEWLAFT
jgi:hypothetical protein